MARREGVMHKVKRRWDETSGDVLGVEGKHRFADEPIGAGTMGGRWAKRGSRRWQGVLVSRGYIAVADKTKASMGVEIDSFETIGFGTMPMGDETMSEHRRQKRTRWWLAEHSLWHDGKALRIECISALQGR